MTRFNFKEACLLDASGELGPAARQALAAYLHENPDARDEYNQIRQQFDALHTAPAGLSPHQQRRIPIQLKSTLQHTFAQRALNKKARTRRKLIRAALAGISSAAAAVLLVATLAAAQADHSWQNRDREQIARLDAAVARFAPPRETAATYDQMLTDVEASLRQLQAGSPTLAQLHDRNMSNLLDALASVSQDWDDFALSEPPPPVVFTSAPGPQ
jgi:anti-sigma factor RsiW